MKKETLRIDGMSCEHCVKAVTKAISGLPGVDSADVNLKNGSAEVIFDEARVNLSDIKAAIEEEGYEVK